MGSVVAAALEARCAVIFLLTYQSSAGGERRIMRGFTSVVDVEECERERVVDGGCSGMASTSE
jgi:hypothetical protein